MENPLILKWLDQLMSNPDKWSLIIIYCLFLALSGASLFIYLFTEVLGFLFRLSYLRLYYESGSDVFRNSSFVSLEHSHFYAGNLLFALLMTIFLRLLSIFYLRLKRRYGPFIN